jgi:hypothetical protein
MLQTGKQSIQTSRFFVIGGERQFKMSQSGVVYAVNKGERVAKEKKTI